MVYLYYEYDGIWHIILCYVDSNKYQIKSVSSLCNANELKYYLICFDVITERQDTTNIYIMQYVCVYLWSHHT